MDSPDVNVLIYAFDEAARDHARYLAWVESRVKWNGGVCPGRAGVERFYPHHHESTAFSESGVLGAVTGLCGADSEQSDVPVARAGSAALGDFPAAVPGNERAGEQHPGRLSGGAGH